MKSYVIRADINCTTCGDTNVLFQKGSRICRDCGNQQQKKRYANLPNDKKKEVLERVVQWGKDNPEKTSQSQRQYQIKYRRVNREKKKDMFILKVINGLLIYKPGIHDLRLLTMRVLRDAMKEYKIIKIGKI